MTDEREIISQLKNPKTQRAAFDLLCANTVNNFIGSSVVWFSLMMMPMMSCKTCFLKPGTISTAFRAIRRLSPGFHVSPSMRVSTSCVRTIIPPSVRRMILPYPNRSWLILISMVLEWRRCCKRRLPHLRASYHIAVKKIAEFFKSRD